MTTNRPVLKLYLDEGVADSVGRVFTDRGHTVIYLRDSIPTGSPDPLVCIVAEANDAILIAHDGDMRQLAKRRGVSNSRYRRLSLIKLSCKESRAADRVTQAMTLIEHEWLISLQKQDRRIFMEIQTDVIRIMR